MLKNYTSVLVLLLRLRQLCSHPALIQENGSHFLAPDEEDEPFESKDVLSRARKEVSSEFVKKMKDKCVAAHCGGEGGSWHVASLLRLNPYYSFLVGRRCSRGRRLRNLLRRPERSREAVVTPCGHEFCNDCLGVSTSNSSNRGQQWSQGKRADGD